MIMLSSNFLYAYVKSIKYNFTYCWGFMNSRFIMSKTMEMKYFYVNNVDVYQLKCKNRKKICMYCCVRTQKYIPLQRVRENTFFS